VITTQPTQDTYHRTAEQVMSTHKKIRCDKLADDDGKAPDSVLLLSLLIRAHEQLNKRDRYLMSSEKQQAMNRKHPE
jgi:hypothetical protein